MNGIFRMADLAIQIDSLNSYVQNQCVDYRSEGLPNLIVQIGQQDILSEREKSILEDMRAGKPAFTRSDGYLESLAVYRKIAEKLPEYDGFVFHGSCVAVDGLAYVFTAKSGTGKSTHTRLWRELLGSQAVMVNDDKPIIRFLDGAPFVFGTPWDGKEHLSSNTSVPLKAVCILERFPENCIREISGHEAFPMLVQQAYRPASPEALEKTLMLLEQLKKQVELYHLDCNMDLNAAKLAYHTMKEG